MKENIIDVGFYGSMHDQSIDAHVIRGLSDDEGVVDYDKWVIDYKKLRDLYSKEYIFELERQAKILFGSCPKIEFSRVESPMFFNFVTDKVVILVDEDETRVFINNALKTEDVRKHSESYIDNMAYAMENCRNEKGELEAGEGDYDIRMLWVVLSYFEDEIDEYEVGNKMPYIGWFKEATDIPD